MKHLLIVLLLLPCVSLKAWWDPGHLVTAMIAYMQLDEPARQRVDQLTASLQRDYPYVNHFIVTGTWPDDLKTEGVRAFDTWHYTNIPFNPDGVALPPRPEVDIVWALDQARSILSDRRARELDKGRFLAFLVHFVGDLHQPLHSTTRYTNDLPGGNQGGNRFLLEGEWSNLHALWDDGCGYLSAYNDIRPYGEPQQPLTEPEIARIQDLARELMEAYPESALPESEALDPSLWAMESHLLAVKTVYYGIQDDQARGRQRYLQPGEDPSESYLQQGQEVVRRQLVLAGYRLGRILNGLFGS